MKEKSGILSRVGMLAGANPRSALVVAGLITLLSIAGMFFLRLEMNFYSILPDNSQAVKDLQIIVEDFPSSNSIIIVLDANTQADLETAARRVQERLGRKDLEEQVNMVSLGYDQDYMQGSGPEIITSTDGLAGLVTVYTNFGINDFFNLASGIEKIEAATEEALEGLDVSAGFTGFLVVAKDEAVTSEQGLAAGFLIALILIVILMILNFRIPSSPIILGLPLLAGIFWTVGITGFTLGRLSIVTSMYLIALMGLGIDFGIHIMTAYVQQSNEGQEEGGWVQRIKAAFKEIDRSLLTGALTTAAAFFALVISESQLAVELGIVAGSGILLELLAMVILVPALLALRAKRRQRKGKPEFIVNEKTTAKADTAASLLSRLAGLVGGHSIRFGLVSVVIAVVLFMFAGGVQIEDNIMNLEAKGLESIELQETLVERFGFAPDPLYLLSESLEETLELHAALEAVPGVKMVDSLALLLPSGGPEVDSIAALPEAVKKLYVSRDGKYNLISIIPEGNLWEPGPRQELLEGLAEVAPNATSMVLASDQMADMVESDGLKAAIAALVIVFLFLLIDFRHLGYSIATMLPLLLATGSLFGIMALTGIKLDFLNFIAVPLLIGIGIDDAVHLSHRYRDDIALSYSGVLARVGRAITMTTVTTVIGFISFI
ncbi:MAG: hypothetical protein D6B26_00470, partial [Spirochaetaceae bacterium]